MKEMPPLSAFYKGWATYNKMLIDVVTPLSPEQLALPVSSPQWTIGRTVQHLAANRVWWFHLWTGVGNPELEPITRWDPSEANEPPVLNSAQLIVGLRSTWDMVADALGRWRAPDLDRVYTAPKVLSEEEQRAFGEVALQWLIWHVVEHEIHHGGEMSLVLGQNGLPGIYGNM